jgi:signal transduction histidine kinase
VPNSAGAGFGDPLLLALGDSLRLTSEASGPPTDFRSIGKYVRALEKDPETGLRKLNGTARPRTLEGRLFGWILALALLPTMVVLAAALGVGTRSLSWLGTLGPWAQVEESGRALLDAAEAVSPPDTTLNAAAERHRAELSESLVQARRWSFLGRRISALAPVGILVVTFVMTVLALAVSRRLARDLARPIRELADWSRQMARGERLPDVDHREAGEVVEVLALRASMRDASARIEESHRRELEAERLRAWGEMARRVAHEMKNPLTPLRLAAHRLSIAPGSDLEEVVSVIREETARLEELARHFAALGRPAEGPASAVDIQELLAGLLSSDVPPNIRSTLHVAPGTSTIDAYYEALLRAFRNLLRNAVEAVESRAEGGTIELSVAPDGRGGIEVVVADNGEGIPEQLEERIFEPDYTRKPGGTGLGLAVVRQTVAAHGGEISARTRPEGGAEFVVRLPTAPPRGNGGATRNGAP